MRGGLTLVLLVLWHFGMGTLSAAERSYVKMSRLGWLAGLGRLPSQTASEYAANVASSIPAVGSDALAIARGYEATVYSGRTVEELGSSRDVFIEALRQTRHGIEEGRAPDATYEAAWRRVRSGLIRRAFGRLRGKR